MVAASEVSLVRELRLDSPINVWLTLSLLRRGPGDPTTRRDGNILWRTSRMASGPVTYALRQVEPTLVRAEAWGPGAAELLDGLPGLVGAEDDPSGFRPQHPVLIDAFRRHAGLRTPRTGRVLEALIAAVIEQKVVGLDAFAAWRRLLLRFGEPPPGPAPAGLRVFPAAEQWAAIPSWEWHRAGVDPQRARTAQACARVGLQVDRLATTHAADHEAVYRGLRSIPGVGVWTAAEVGIRALGDSDAVPFGDYHVAKDVGTALLGRPIDDVELAEVLEPWRPHRFRVVQLIRLSPFATRERRGPRMPRVDHRHI
ncbi:DNA-3-methyladenine glycosylase family protein [Aeromicrobium ginsengisoli]|uniref:DNA-3-methyladenine glycosylase 2 family protein n=1 Tax=Aeromicrobium ginsengisoli TaxID=363867 RepID=A0A5M4FGZ4_9ACTN|nr:DNA-3-methyladenine glycosylase [Aeromicrobium ginsengisoli]KAA1399387.1 DNA-3-methyladenine glycosylase 2 family protein [Aeromicrobium ginsengisoli]